MIVWLSRSRIFLAWSDHHCMSLMIIEIDQKVGNFTVFSNQLFFFACNNKLVCINFEWSKITTYIKSLLEFLYPFNLIHIYISIQDLTIETLLCSDEMAINLIIKSKHILPMTHYCCNLAFFNLYYTVPHHKLVGIL